MRSARPPWLYAAGAIVLIAIAGIAVPAWADPESPDADEPFAIPVPPPGPHGLSAAGHPVAPTPEQREELDQFVDCMREHGADIPGVRFGPGGEGVTIEEADAEAIAEAEEACGPPPAPPPLSKEQIEAHRAALDEIADCMREHGED